MSWAQYVQTLEAGKGRCKYAGIFSRSPVTLWAESADKSIFPITVEDVAKAAKAIQFSEQEIMCTGIKIGEKLCFTCLRMENELLICQGKGQYKDYSLVIALSGQAIIIGFNPEPEVKTACVRDAVEVIRDYLKIANF